MADEAVCIGPPPSNQSYLMMDNVIDACLKTGAQAVSLSLTLLHRALLSRIGISVIGYLYFFQYDHLKLTIASI